MRGQRNVSTGLLLKPEDRLLASPVIHVRIELPKRLKEAVRRHIIGVWPGRGATPESCAFAEQTDTVRRSHRVRVEALWGDERALGFANPELLQRITSMKHLLTGVAVAAALAIAAPAWAQNPSGGNAVGTPGPNPGGPGLTPYSSGPPAAQPAPPTSPPPAAMPPAASAPPAPNSAMPPMHRHARAMHHPMHGMHHGPAVSGDTTAQLNREELTRIQSGNTSNPAAPPAPPSGPGPSPKYLPGPKPN